MHFLMNFRMRPRKISLPFEFAGGVKTEVVYRADVRYWWSATDANPLR